MKTINDFLDKSPLWQIYIFGWLFTGSLFGGAFYLLSPLTGIVCAKVGVNSGLILGLMFPLVISGMRKSKAFWENAIRIEILIEFAEDRESLDKIFDVELRELSKKFQLSLQQKVAFIRLCTILKTKYRYIGSEQNKKKQL